MKKLTLLVAALLLASSTHALTLKDLHTTWISYGSSDIRGVDGYGSALRDVIVHVDSTSASRINLRCAPLMSTVIVAQGDTYICDSTTAVVTWASESATTPATGTLDVHVIS